ncbi:hypothetical protein TNCV_1904661 [Trichonephila clavipes]|nr:hypothetical protein TNCV_1904661 [Trichonephila clavipes]
MFYNFIIFFFVEIFNICLNKLEGKVQSLESLGRTQEIWRFPTPLVESCFTEEIPDGLGKKTEYETDAKGSRTLGHLMTSLFSWKSGEEMAAGKNRFWRTLSEKRFPTERLKPID